MAYQDMLITCEECDKQFIFRVEDQRRMAARGEEVTPPDVCAACRGEEPRTYAAPPPPKREEKAPAPQPEAEPEPLGAGPHEGEVKWYDPEKGYGFIAHPSGNEVFFHRTGIAPGEPNKFPDGTKVTFCVEETEKGPQAVEVERMEG
jgi:CspA family cold shock protein